MPAARDGRPHEHRRGGPRPLAESLADSPTGGPRAAGAVSARNRLPGIVTGVRKDTVMAQVEHDLRPVPPGVPDVAPRPPTSSASSRASRAIASVKSTNVVVERP